MQDWTIKWIFFKYFIEINDKCYLLSHRVYHYRNWIRYVSEIPYPSLIFILHIVTNMCAIMKGYLFTIQLDKNTRNKLVKPPKKKSNRSFPVFGRYTFRWRKRHKKKTVHCIPFILDVNRIHRIWNSNFHLRSKGQICVFEIEWKTTTEIKTRKKNDRK